LLLSTLARTPPRPPLFPYTTLFRSVKRIRRRFRVGVSPSCPAPVMNPVRPRDVLPTPLSEFRVEPSDVLHNLSGHIQHAPTGSVVGHVVLVLVQNIQLILRRTLRPLESPHEVWFGGVDIRLPPPIMGGPDVVIQQEPMIRRGFRQKL